jgi:hypothetical protein
VVGVVLVKILKKWVWWLFDMNPSFCIMIPWVVLLRYRLENTYFLCNERKMKQATWKGLVLSL